MNDSKDFRHENVEMKKCEEINVDASATINYLNIHSLKFFNAGGH